MTKQIPVSVIINTADRAKYLGDTLEGLKAQTYDNFEVIVVNGPSEDNTEEVAKSFNVRYYTAPYNLSVSRNIGVKAAAGEILLFIDDDAVPTPSWIEEVVAAYDDPAVGGAGGYVYHTGNAHYQFCYGAVSMWGLPRVEMEPGIPFNFNQAHGEWYNINLGTNASYRRSYLIGIGGFDEEYEYYHDESDVCVRMIDAGHTIVQLDGATVHHKMAPSSRRKSWKSVVNWDSMVKNGIYFALKHTKGKAGPLARLFKPGWEERHKFKVTAGALKRGEINLWQFIYKFFSLWRAIFRGYYRGYFQNQKFIAGYRYKPENFHKYKENATKPFKRYNIVLVSQGFPPAATDGIARYNFTLAKELTRQGHHVSVVTKSPDGTNQIFYEKGYWVYRYNPAEYYRQVSGYERVDSILASSKAIYNLVKSIKQAEGVDVILTPLWDVEGLALIRHKLATTIVTLMSPLKKVVETQWSNVEDPSIEFVYDLERYVIDNADAVMTISKAVADTIQKEYGIVWRDLDIPLRVLPLGVDGSLVYNPEQNNKDDRTPKDITVLFVGRFEKRKGIDLLLEVIPSILRKHKNVRFRLVGNATLNDPDGRNYWNDFKSSYKNEKWFKQITQEGYVSDEDLAAAYAECDIFVAPSRYESFGLIFIEAMANAKPVIGTNVGGIPETVSDGKTGFLFEPENSRQLEEKIESLIQDPELRRNLGRNAKAAVETKFSSEKMAKDFVKLLEDLKLQ